MARGRADRCHAEGRVADPVPRRGALALAALLAGGAAPQPMTLAAQAFEDPIENAQAYTGSSCRIQVVALEDKRSDPEMVGVYMRRAVKAPRGPAAAWLPRASSTPWARRGVQPTFVADPAAGDGIRVAICLEREPEYQCAQRHRGQSVVFRVEERGTDSPTPRCGSAETSRHGHFFGGGEGKIQRGVDSAVRPRTLDGMAAHFRNRCRASSRPHDRRLSARQ